MGFVKYELKEQYAIITIDREKNISIAFHTEKVLAERMAMLE